MNINELVCHPAKQQQLQQQQEQQEQQESNYVISNNPAYNNNNNNNTHSNRNETTPLLLQQQPNDGGYTMMEASSTNTQNNVNELLQNSEDTDGETVMMDSSSATAEDTFINRVSSIPIVNRSTNTIKYFTPAIVTDQITNITDNLSTSFPSINKFACTQLDKLEKSFPYIVGKKANITSPTTSAALPNETFVDYPQPPSSGPLTVDNNGGVVANMSSFVISDELLKGIRYCLDWIQYATQRIDSQLRLLAEYVLSMSSSSNDEIVPRNPTLFERIQIIKKDLIETVRRVVDVIGRHAALYLPGEAKQSVRGFILSLPTRFSATAESTQTENNNSEAGETLQLPTPPLSPTQQANKVIAFGNESSDMLKGVYSVFSQTLSTAESYLGRRVSQAAEQEGLLEHHRQQQQQEQQDTEKGEDHQMAIAGIENMDLD